MADKKRDWALPFMRGGYAGRGLTYVIFATLSLWAIWQGGEADGMTDTLAKIEGSTLGKLALAAIAVGLISYMLWRLIDGALDLEDEGTDPKGLIARIGQIITGLIHGILGIAVISILWKAGSNDEGQSAISKYTGEIMQMPLGIYLVGAVGFITLCSGIYYLHKAYTQDYRENLQGNHFTRHWSKLLQLGVAAQGITVGVIGALFMLAAWQSDPNEAGGTEAAMSWLSDQIYGQVLVTALCLGLLLFALFMFVNAAYRIVPKLSDPDVKSLAQTVKAKAT